MGAKKILVIEEDLSLFKAYQEMFKPQNVDVLGAATGQEGLKMALSEKPDVILLDIMLPGGLNGFDVLERLKTDEATKKIPVIMLTNLDTEESVAKTIGAKAYLVKANSSKDQIIKTVLDCFKSS